MYEEDMQDIQEYKVVINHERQYSIWPVGRENPPGWYDVGKVGEKAICLNYIKDVWVDMRPASIADFEQN
ncbi:MAG TPA: MbtH family NRPS accessory protein [Ktedonobacteraceae bacterium]|nr:MbtH family NRPS accessory protein [Ktedonobacteraceae bacterium]